MDTAFFIASKIIWGLIRPETLLILLLWASFSAVRSHHPHIARRRLGFALLVVLAIAILPLGDLVLRPLESLYPAQPKLNKVAGIIVLGGGADTDRSASWGVPVANEAGDRYLAALSLASTYPKAPIYFTGGNGNLIGSDTSEAPIAKTIFTGAGISSERLHFESASRSTAENATLLRKTITKQSAGQWILVTSAYHMPRAMGSFCAAGWTNLIAWPMT